jgi:hypothetical protein
MKLLKLIPVVAIVLTAFTTFEAKAGYPSGYTKKTSCDWTDGYKYYKLQKTDTPASYGVYANYQLSDEWIIENVSYDCATNWYKYRCGWKRKKPTCTM